MRRALGMLEQQALHESERALAEADARASAEAAASAKFHELAAEMREASRADEASRARALEARLRSHYGATLAQLQEQLDLALEVRGREHGFR